MANNHLQRSVATFPSSTKVDGWKCQERLSFTARADSTWVKTRRWDQETSQKHISCVMLAPRPQGESIIWATYSYKTTGEPKKMWREFDDDILQPQEWPSLPLHSLKLTVRPSSPKYKGEVSMTHFSKPRVGLGESEWSGGYCSLKLTVRW